MNIGHLATHPSPKQQSQLPRVATTVPTLWHPYNHKGNRENSSFTQFLNGLYNTLLCTCSCFFPLFLPSAFLRPSSCVTRSVVAGVVITAPVAKRRSRSSGLGKVLRRPRRPHRSSAVSVVRRRRILERSLSCLRSCYLKSLVLQFVFAGEYS